MELKKIKLNFKVAKPVLALGSNTKNTVCFAKGGLALVSGINADLDDPKDYLSFEKEVKYFLKQKPRVVSYDLHPEYQSTRYASVLAAKHYILRGIQHHHAHIASCMAENAMKNDLVIGVAFDGTGLGSDEMIWGAEFLLCDYRGFVRKAHLREIPLLGGQQAIVEPWRIVAAWLYTAFGDRFLNLGIDFTKKIDRRRWRILKSMHALKINSPLASSMGRLFDAAGSIILAKHKAGFEAELAIDLEKLAGCCGLKAGAYIFNITKKGRQYIIDPVPVIKEIVNDLKTKSPKQEIASKFHLAVAAMAKEVCLKLRKESGINKVVLSGGVFQNNLLASASSGLLYKEGFEIFTHKHLSCNDSNISLGQAVIASYGV